MKKRDTEANKEMMIKSLEEKNGLISKACQKVGIARLTHYRWCEQDEQYANAVAEIIESKIDYVEGKLLENIDKNDQRAIEYYLNSKAAHRGYGSHLRRAKLDDAIEEQKPLDSGSGKVSIMIPHNGRDDIKTLQPGRDSGIEDVDHEEVDK